MEVTGVCFTLLMFILLAARVKSDEAFYIVTNRMQYFKYELISLRCESLDGSTQFKGIRNTEGFLSSCKIKTSPGFSCNIEIGYPGDSGLYWCETKRGERSKSVNITITAGSVILESPVLPVMDGANVTLGCRKRNISDVAADFYKDGVIIGSSATGELTIKGVSKSHEGLYKCSISGAGESPENWLTLNDPVTLECPVVPVMEGISVILECSKNNTFSNITSATFYKDGLFMWSSSTGKMTISSVSKSDEGFYKCRISAGGESDESWLAVRAPCRETCLPLDNSMHIFHILRIVFTILMVALLLLLVGLLHFDKFKVTEQK
ncbi:high affinity immunoglobulin gamma Fc receptor I-like [Anabas testudineus]|uniref:high affinity immunoglobulin gamma Fc receptor I-like n=1 Tax=Anabas testudineus TaxID=64144 RepID=UPI000E4574BE|nr:high affinity immunoglobulin gamma Fc receptor I-like [Anabas testudineus]